ncbi:putative taurine transporter [Danaus plexippus plexippus]|uniref:Taurine transporter n=1 Tax=Danaus plexippus plexippus TaxID=278856 RepID=A0A212FIU6_DANPL|nr:putative taurine transporter [Danaus plexippus plexippus]
MATRNPVSVETILTFDNRDAQSQWSEVWSTTHIPGMDNASGGDGLSGIQGRKKLRFGALILGTFLTMHCRVTASALTGGVFVFILFHILATVTLANPLRHFEVYLGQWSISGPGRAFRILPMFEGLGIAICINALVRAIICCTMAAICAIYVVYSVSDSKLPFSYCRDFDLRPYDPIQKDISLRMLRESRFSLVTAGTEEEEIHNEAVTVGIRDFAWRNASKLKSKRKRQVFLTTGHIDPHLNGENVWHSGLLLLMTGLHSSGAAICAIVDNIQPNNKNGYDMREIILCGRFAEQVVVAGIILTCMGLSFLFATSGGVALLESVDALMTGISTPFVCILELVAILYVYRGRDFVSDMNIATEENACSSRIDTQWQIIPIITLVTLIIKLSVVFVAELPKMSLAYAAAALVAVVIAGPLRAARNAVVFWRARRHK